MLKKSRDPEHVQDRRRANVESPSVIAGCVEDAAKLVTKNPACGNHAETMPVAAGSMPQAAVDQVDTFVSDTMSPSRDHERAALASMKWPDSSVGEEPRSRASFLKLVAQWRDNQQPSLLPGNKFHIVAQVMCPAKDDDAGAGFEHS